MVVPLSRRHKQRKKEIVEQADYRNDFMPTDFFVLGVKMRQNARIKVLYTKESGEVDQTSLLQDKHFQNLFILRNTAQMR